VNSRNHDFSGRRDKRRAQNTARAAEQRAEQKRFEEIAMMRPKSFIAPAGDLATLAARIAALEAVQRQAFDQAMVKHDAVARWFALLALLASIAAAAIAAVDFAARVGVFH
jgi:hypothetical protein